MPAPIPPTEIGLNQIRDRLENPMAAMEAVGAVLIAAAQKAFEDQQFGSFKWPAQYESGKAPWIHIAGAADDLRTGERIKGSRFGPVDPLKDSGDLWRSIDYKKVARDEVVVGTSVPYAQFHQWGSKEKGPSVQPVTSSMRRRLSREYADADDEKKKAIGKLWHWFRKDSIETHVRQRPFLGITDEIEDQIRQTVEMFVETGRVG